MGVKLCAQDYGYRGCLILRYPDGATMLMRHPQMIQAKLDKFAADPKGMNGRFEWEGRDPWNRRKGKGGERNERNERTER